MSVYDLQNVTVEEIGNPAVMYRITSNSGYYIHIPSLHEELTYKTVVALLASFDFSTVQIVAEADLPEGAEICGDVTDTETM